jgi:hypothetical protein
MKLPDNEVLDDDTYWLIKDTWKLDWEKGVQVPVKPELNKAYFENIKTNDTSRHTNKTKTFIFKL